MYMCAFFRHYSIFFSRTPKCPGSYPWGFAYTRLGTTRTGASCLKTEAE